MIDGLMRLVVSNGQGFDMMNYVALRDHLRELESLDLYPVMPMPMASGVMLSGRMSNYYSSNYHGRSELKNQIRGVMESLIESGWGHLPEIEANMKDYSLQQLSPEYDGVMIPHELSSVYYPTKEDIGSKIEVDGMPSYVVNDMTGSAVVIRRNMGSSHQQTIEMLAEENGEPGLFLLPGAGIGYALARMVGLSDFAASSYKSINRRLIGSKDKGYFEAQLRKLE
ncbi:MAG: hypothetical protein NDI94_02820 [Candidatus Woesearchaeota archaeon]|nr:hypothetical protein [Candidatus Woesearchaeota archaeon]